MVMYRDSQYCIINDTFIEVDFQEKNNGSLFIKRNMQKKKEIVYPLQIERQSTQIFTLRSHYNWRINKEQKLENNFLSQKIFCLIYLALKTCISFILIGNDSFISDVYFQKY